MCVCVCFKRQGDLHVFTVVYCISGPRKHPQTSGFCNVMMTSQHPSLPFFVSLVSTSLHHRVQIPRHKSLNPSVQTGSDQRISTSPLLESCFLDSHNAGANEKGLWCQEFHVSLSNLRGITITRLLKIPEVGEQLPKRRVTVHSYDTCIPTGTAPGVGKRLHTLFFSPSIGRTS